MSVHNFEYPILNVTGTSYRNNMEASIEALASTMSGNVEPPTTFPGMLQVFGDTNPVLRVRNVGNDGWVTLLPDTEAPYGGLEEVLGLPDTVTGDHTFSGTVEFTGPTSITSLGLGSAINLPASSTAVTPSYTDYSTNVPTTAFVKNIAKNSFGNSSLVPRSLGTSYNQVQTSAHVSATYGPWSNGAYVVPTTGTYRVHIHTQLLTSGTITNFEVKLLVNGAEIYKPIRISDSRSYSGGTSTIFGFTAGTTVSLQIVLLGSASVTIENGLFQVEWLGF